MGRVSASRVITHAMWISVLATLPTVFVEMFAFNALDHDPDLGRGIDAAALMLLLFVPFWVPPVVLDAVVIGLASAGAYRLFRGRGGGLRVWAAAAAGALVGGAASAGWVLAFSPDSLRGPLEPSSGLVVLIVVGVVTGAVGGGVGVFLADRSGRRDAATPWGVAAVAAGAVAAVIAIYLAMYAHPWYPEYDCAARLQGGGDAARSVDVGFPPQTWCVSLDAIQKWDDSWLGGAVWLAGAASLACAAIAIDGGWGASRRPTTAVLTTAVVVVVAGSGGAIWSVTAVPSADQIEQARNVIRAAQPAAPPASRTEAPPDFSAGVARTDLRRLGEIARDVAGHQVLWPQRPRIAAESCTLPSGGQGVVVSLTGRFTARDPADVHGPEEMLALERANEEIAAQIGANWTASGLLSEGEVTHGEWHFGPDSASEIEVAHLGFTNGIGEFQLASYCARR